MSHIPPDEVVAPRGTWKLECVIYDEGEDKIAVACGHWEAEAVVALRWNGTREPGKTMGNPQSSGHPTWFILPRGMGRLILDALIERSWPVEDAVRRKNLSTYRAWLA